MFKGDLFSIKIAKTLHFLTKTLVFRLVFVRHQAPIQLF